MNNRERGWPEDCKQCDLYDQKKPISAVWTTQYQRGADGSACTGRRHGDCGGRYWEEMGIMNNRERG